MHLKYLLMLPLLVLVMMTIAWAADPEVDKDTGLIIAPGFAEVKETCTVCHSAMLITQNKADRDGWIDMIRWMQDKQGLQELEPKLENTILDYLAKHYAPTATSRRPPLQITFPE
ncbi:hypothetical protein [Pelobacter seleniigenes]|uniref:hypothetical protein n=1 Tax=Pelobacter seleniigenes TaxID=407188 RepID=UPI0004A6B305|nr:hypothetical protein [Pelobacter seleniigenes]